jgi:hypothetical protein
VGGNVRIRSFADGLPLSVERAAPEFVVFYLIFSGLLAFLLIRRGLLCIVAFFVFDYVNSSFPLTPKGAWYAGMSLAGILLMATLAVYAFHTPWVADRFSEAVPRLRSELPWETCSPLSPA